MLINTSRLQNNRKINTTDSCRTSRSHRILVVDDEPVVRSFTMAILVRSGYEVDSARDGADAWTTLNKKNYDLLITDNSMPKITGIGLIKMLRDHALSLPVIMATGAYPTAELERYPWLEISAILLKPYAIGDLLKTVKKTLNETRSIAVAGQLLLFPDSKNIVPQLAFHAHESAERFLLEEPLPRL
jgi:DNA-binding response OmpR family regulator